MKPPTKTILRRQARVTRAAFARSGDVIVATAYRDSLAPGTVVASYIPIGDEADPAPLALAALAAGGRIALPHVVDRAGALRFLAWRDGDVLVPGPFGLRQPDAAAPPIEPAIILTPLLAFDRRGHRLGQGAGHYDRAFAAYPGTRRIGIGWSVQEIDTMPTDPWDIPLHAVATEKEWIEMP